MSSYSLNYGTLTYDGLSFTNIDVNEVDVGDATSFVSTSGDPLGVLQVYGPPYQIYAGLAWENFDSNISGANSSESLTFTFNVSAGPGEAISALNALYLVDAISGPDAGVNAVETAYDTGGDLLATQTWTAGETLNPVAFTTAEQNISVTLTLTESIGTGGNSASNIDMSLLETTFAQVSAPAPTASIGDIVFDDVSGSGQEAYFNAGPGVAGVTVDLLTGNGQTVIESTVTGANGQYEFTGLEAGTYEVEFVAPTNYTFSQQGVGGPADAGINSSANQTTGITAPIVLTAGEVDNNVEAGLVPTPPAENGTAALGDYVWFDTNQNGTIDVGENGVSGVTVELLSGSSVIAETITSAGGYYNFTGLTAGVYQVEFVAPSPDGFTIEGVGTVASQDSSANQVTGITAPVTLTTGEIDNNVEAGLTLNASVTLDKQISTNGSTWVDVGNGNLNNTVADDPNVLVGSNIFERVIVVNTGSVAITSASIGDAGGNGPAGFTIGGNSTFTMAVGATLTSNVATITAGSGYELDTATVTGSASDSLGNTETVSASDEANYTGVTAGISLDKQISTDGVNWVDVGNGNLADDPDVLVGAKLYEQVVVVNTGSVAITTASVTDAGGNGPSGFTFGGGGTFTLAAGQTLTSDVATITAASNYELDTATVGGTASDSYGNSTTVTASDQANYTGVTAGVSLDKQISVDGVNWVDVGNGDLAQDPAVLTGTTLYEQVVVVNTGSVAITSADVTDAGGNGPSGFTFGGSGTFTLAAGQTLTSDVATITASAGYELDTATVTGTAADTYGNTTTVSASDQANYTEVAGSIALDKQISVNGGSTWVDQGTGSLSLTGTNDPSVLVGGNVLERVILVNTGTVAITGASVSDAGGNGPAGFTVGGDTTFTLAAGQTIASDVATIAAGAGTETDIATVTGTVTDSYNNSTTIGASDTANYTGITASVTLDKEISTNGTTWQDVGVGNLSNTAADDPNVLVGAKLFERVIVTNNGSVALSGITVGDVGGNGPASFAVGSTLSIGASETSTVATITAASAYELDKATVSGTGTDNWGNTTPVSASDQANYTGLSASVTLDKQISTDGSTWVEAGVGNLAADPSVLVGAKVYERVVVVNTGSVAITSASVSDVGGNGPSGFSFASGNSFTLAAGGTITSNVATVVAASGLETDTATVTGSAADSYGNTTTVTASDQADYTGVTPGITIDKQVSTNDSTWVDVGNLVLTGTNDPNVLVGAKVYERVIVVNTGSVAVTAASVSDVGGNGPSSFSFSSGGTFTLAALGTITSNVATITAGTGYEQDTATVTGTATVNNSNTVVSASDEANYTGLPYGISLDKQISTDGVNWQDVGANNLAQDPQVFVGANVFERVIVVNTGSVAITGASVSDVGGNGPSGFTFSSGNSFTLAAGGTITSNVATIAAGAGYEEDTATVTGSVSDSYGNTATVTATDKANYTGVSASITLDKQISVNGCTWLDVGSLVLTGTNDPNVLVGTKLYERVIVVNTGSLAITGASISDVGGNGPSGFTVGSGSTFTLAAGGTVTSNVATITAGSGYELDTATVSGTATDTTGTSTTVTASDEANYTGLAPSVTLDKQISTNGTTWLDVGNLVLTGTNDPNVLDGAKLFERVIVVNTGSVALTGLAVGDSGGNGPSSFSVGSTLAIGASETSTVATITAANGYELDTATVTGKASDSYGDTANVSASDQANYTGLSYGVSLDKQISTDGTTWLDVGNGNLAQDPVVAVGAKVYERVIVVNTGSVAITSAQVKDVGGNGPANFAFGSSNTFTLAAGGTITSTVATITAASGYQLDTATVTGSVSDSYGNTGTVSASDQANYTTTSSGISVNKVPCEMVVNSCGQVTYTFDVTNTGSTPLSNIHLTDNIGTAANPDIITPTLVTQTGNGVLAPGQTWVYSATINESGDYTCNGGSQKCTVSSSGQHLSSGCTAWLNSSFTPTNCKSGTTYNFKDITCTISGPGCSTTTIKVPDSCVTFSSSCTSATTTYNSSENCWVTTLPANCNPGNVFLSGLPYQVPSGCNLAGATVTWNIGQSANNCGSSSVSWQTGCTGYSSFDQNNCNGQSDYNQIGVKSCDNGTGYGDGGCTNQGYGWNSGGNGGYCGSGNSWNGSGSDCAGTPENQYCGSNCGSGSGGNNNNGCGGGNNNNGCGGGNNNTGTCGGGSGSGTCCQVQLCDSSEADTATVTATTLGNGFSLGDAANYGIIAFGPNSFIGSSTSPITGNVGLGVNCGNSTVQLNNDKITGNLVTTGAAPKSPGGTVTGSIIGNSSTLAADISALQALSLALGSETGTSESLTTGETLNATSGTLDSSGDYVFTITKWANNLTINGTGSNNVVLNIASGVTPNLDNVTLTGGLTANQVLFNDENSGTINGTSGDTFNGTFLAPNAVFNVSGVKVNGHLFGGASGQNFSFVSGATLTTPANTGSGTPTITTVSASDSTEVQVLCANSPITVNGTAPTGSLSSLYGAAAKLELEYNPGNTVSVGTIGIGAAVGSNSSSMAFIEITNNSNPFASGAQVYFEGEVQTGEKLYADATLNQLTNTPVAAPNNTFDTSAGAEFYAYIFSSQAAFQADTTPTQTITYNASGSQAMHLGDTVGSLSLIGYVGTNGGHLVS